jgi:hypothetical protein
VRRGFTEHLNKKEHLCRELERKEKDYELPGAAYGGRAQIDRRTMGR